MKFSVTWLVVWVVVVVIIGVIFRYWCCPEPECCDKHFVDVYLKNDGLPYTQSMGPDSIETLLLFPGDYVIWNNTAESDATLGFGGNTSWFGVGTATIPKNQRLILQVTETASGSGDYTINIGPGQGTPKVKIGDDP